MIDTRQNSQFQVVPSDTTDFKEMPDVIHVSDGNIKVTDMAGNEVTYTVNGTSAYIYGKFRRVWATGTTATGIVGIIYGTPRKLT